MFRRKFEKIIAKDDAKRAEFRQMFYDAVSDSDIKSDLMATEWYWMTVQEFSYYNFNVFYYNNPSDFDEGVKESDEKLTEMMVFVENKIRMIDKIRKQIERNKENWERFKENPSMFLVAQDYRLNNHYLFACQLPTN